MPQGPAAHHPHAPYARPAAVPHPPPARARDPRGWAALARLGALQSEHPVTGQWGTGIFAGAFFGASALAAALGVSQVRSFRAALYGNWPQETVVALLAAAGLALVGALLAYLVWNDRYTAVAVFERGVAYRDRKGERAFAFAEIGAVKQLRTHNYRNGQSVGTDYQYELRTRAGETMAFSGSRYGDIAIFGLGLVGGTAAASLPDALRLLDSGGSVQFGRLRVSAWGLQSAAGALPWPQVASVTVSNGALLTFDRAGRRVDALCADLASLPHAPVLFDLLKRVGKLA